jgi:hypothetical protein
MSKETQQIIFTLESKELKDAQKWIKSQMKKHGKNIGTIGDRFSYRFTPTSIGVGISVIDNLSKEEKNVTDYSCW